MSGGRHDANTVAAGGGAVRAEPAVKFLPSFSTAGKFSPVKPRAYGDNKTVVGDLIEKAGGHKEVAHRFGLHISMIYAYCDPAQDKEISLARAASLTSPDNTVAAEYLAALAGGAFMPLPRGEGSMMLLTADLAREVGETVSSIVSGLADGAMNLAETETALQEIDDDLAIMMALRAEVLARRDALKAGA